jgi:hypothetical protein
MESHESLREIEPDFVKALYKLLAAQIGTMLGKYIVYASRETSDERIKLVDQLLSEAV